VSTDLGQVSVAIRDERASRIAELYALHAPRTGRIAYLLTGDPELAEDLAQEAFVRLMGRLSSIREDAAIAAYLRRSIVNLARKHWRRLGHERGFVRRGGSDPVPSAQGHPDIAGRDELWRALGTLPHRQRAAIVLRFYEDLSERETARILGCAVGTIKSAVSRGLQRMREEMIGDADVRT
jgi:RNA polymerase sigma-70 factor (sigma-E family)